MIAMSLIEGVLKRRVFISTKRFKQFDCLFHGLHQLLLLKHVAGVAFALWAVGALALVIGPSLVLPHWLLGSF